MNLYDVNDGDSTVMVVAHTAKEAKPLGYEQFYDMMPMVPEYIDFRVRRVWGARVPAEITTPKAFPVCNDKPDWLCDAWQNGEMCSECRHWKGEEADDDSIIADINRILSEEVSQ
jgi:hypothetical protein